MLIDDEAKTVEVVRREGRVRKRDAVVARAGFDEAKLRLADGELLVEGTSVRLGKADAEAVMGILVGPRMSKVVQEAGEAALSFLQARARAMEFSAELKERPRGALFRAKEADPGSAEGSIDSMQSSLAGEAERSFESLRALFAGEKSGLAQPGANRIWAAVYAVGLIQDSVRSKDEAGVQSALAFLGGVSPDEWPSASEVMALGLQEATAKLTQRAFAKVALADKDWAI